MKKVNTPFNISAGTFLKADGLSYGRNLKSRIYRAFSLVLLLSTLFIANMAGQSFSQSTLNFNGNGGVNGGTSLMYGPDGRLYVLNINGTIDVFTVQKNGPNNYVVTASEELSFVQDIPNHNDDGSATTGNNREATGLTVAGTAAVPVIYVTSSDSRTGGPSGDLNLDTNSGVITRLTKNGTSWDVVDIVRGLPRSEENHATNGLEFVTLGSTDFLIVAQGGHANAGAPSTNFAWTTEYALSAAVLSVNLTMLEGMPVQNDGVRNFIYDLPTLDDPTRANVGPTDPDAAGYTGVDVNDPWGGNDGLNQAMVVIGGPVQIFSPGYRNAYDLVVTESGAVYVTDNGANGGWGGLPENEGTANVTNNYIAGEPGSSSSIGGEQVDNVDHLTLVTTDISSYTFGSFYGGHPAPVRANVNAGLFTRGTHSAGGPGQAYTDSYFRTEVYDPDGSTSGSETDPQKALPANWPPVPPGLIDPIQGDWRGPTVDNLPDGPNDELVTVWSNNTNGIDEYTATVFTGSESMAGNLIAGKSGGTLWRVELNGSGGLQRLSGGGQSAPNGFVAGLSGNPLGISCNSDTDPFPGTIWVATFNNSIIILEPQPTVVCIPVGDPLFVGTDDTDLDGYSNQDEVDNGTDHCNGGDQPDDFDKAAGPPYISDLNDPDDDNDGIDDADDPFQIGDPLNNGSDAFDLPVTNELYSDNTALGGYLGLGFTGLMNNGDPNPNWLNLLDVVDAGPNPNDILGGAAGAMTMHMTEGTALGTTAQGGNSQEKGFQYGVNVDQGTGGFTVAGRLLSLSDPLQLYGSSAPANGELGIFIGDGTQSNYIKLVINQNGLEARQEIADSPQAPITSIINVADRPVSVEFFFVVNATTGVVTMQYKLDDLPVQTLGTITAEGTILAAIQNSGTPLAVGLIGSSNTPGTEVEGTWDYLNVTGSQPSIAVVMPDLDRLIDAPSEDIDLDTYFDDDNGTSNLAYTIESNTDPSIGAGISGNILTLTYPAIAATSAITIRATDGGGLFTEQTFTVNVTEQPAVLFRVNAGDVLIAATDAPNPDWASNSGAGAQTGTGFAVNTGTISTQNVTGRHTSVPAYAPQALFVNERYDVAQLPEMEWTFDTGNGTFTVNLYYGNGFSGTSAPGQRVFDVHFEGLPVINDKDLSAEYGHQMAAMESYQVTVSDGVLNIEFIHQTENPLINAIEIMGAGSGFPPITVDAVANQVHNLGETPILNIIASGGDPNENLVFSATGLPPGLTIEPTNGAILGTISSNAGDAGQYNSTVTVSKTSSTPVNVNFAWTVLDPTAPNTVVYRINTGGALTPSTDASPTDWEEDQSVATANGTAVTGTPSGYVNAATEDLTFGAALPGAFVNNTGYPDGLFTTERYNTQVIPDNMQWDFPVSNGSYTVNLIFAEIWTGAQTSGIRVFDVSIEEQPVLTNFDQTAAYGWATAGVETFVVDVADGNLDIDFIQGIQNPNIKAIEIISSATPPVNDLWSSITNVTEHTPRHENSFVQVGDKFYLFGGRESSDKMDIYDYQTNTWTTAASTAPFEFNHFQAVAYEGLIWVIGSFMDNGFPTETPADNIYLYDPVTDTWIEGPAIPNNRKRGSAGLVMYNDKFYVIAGNTIGHDGGYINWFDEYDPATGVWTTLANAPRARDHFHAAVIGTKLYVVGGRLTGGTGGTFAPVIPEVDVYDFANPGWSTLPAGSNLPNPRAASSTVNFQGKVVVIGGEGNGQAYANTDALNVSTGNWEPLDDLNNARHGTQAIVSGDGIWVSSGSPNQGGGSQNNMEVYGTDNPTGIPITAGTLTLPATAIVPSGDVLSILISNSGGNQGIYVTGLALTGANAANFTVLGATGFLVPAGGSRSVEIAHTGTNEGEVAALNVSYGNSSIANTGLTSGPAPSAILYRVNGGGALVTATDAPNQDWSVDQGSFGIAGNSPYLAAASTENGIFEQSSPSAYQGPVNMTHPSLPPGTPSNLFTSERYDAAGDPEMLWQFPVPAGSEVEIRLYFAEMFNGITTAGQRVFDVSVEGEVPPVFTAIDPFATAGALGAFMVSHTMTITDGILDLEFIHGVENPAIKGIEIVDVSGSTTGIAPLVTNPGGQVGVDGDPVNLQIVASDGNTEPCGPLTYEALNLPPNLSIDPATGLISGALLAGSGSGTAGAFIEASGVVVMEAETDFVDTAGGWNLTTESGEDFMSATSDNFNSPNGQTVVKSVQITTPGVYRFHIKSNITGTVTTDENDSWFKIDNSADVHFFAVQGGALTGTQEFLNEQANPSNTTKSLYYPAGNAMGRAGFGSENPGSSGYFKVYRSGGGGNKWSTFTIDNNSFPIYAYFPIAGTFTLSMSERSAGHKIDKIALVHIDDQFTNVNVNLLDGFSESQQAVGGTPGASENSPYNVTVNVTDACVPPLTTQVAFSWNVTATPIGNPAAMVQVTPGNPLSASTFGDNSFIINNTGDDDIINVTLNTSTGHMMDVVFDPVGTAGDSTAKCLTNGNGNTPAQVGLTVNANGAGNANCIDVFDLPHNGLNNEEGYDAMSLDFTDFNPSESFVFGVDMDPTSIKGDLTSGDAGSISGFELIGTTISVTFASGVTYTTSLFDEGSLGGSDAIIDIVSNSLTAPAILVDGSAASRLVTEADQLIQINGQPNGFVTLLRVDGRLFIDPGNPSLGYDVDLFEANEAMAKELYTIQLDGTGAGTIPVVLTVTPGTSGTPDGGVNQFIAVTTGPAGENSIASNVIVLEYDPNAVIAPSALVEITPGAALDASTFSASSFQITNTSLGAVQITNVTIDLSTATFPDMVFDPTGSGGDATASCFTPNTGAATVGLINPANACVDPFSQPRNGGFDQISVDFSEFDPAEYFDFTTDIDPNSIQGVAGAGNAGAVSGFELIGATITVSFSDGSVLTGTLYEDGSPGGGQVVVAENPPTSPSISVVGVGAGPSTVNSLDQTVTVTGTPGDNVSLLVLDSRLFIASGDPPFNVPDPTYYANEAMAGKSLFTGVIGAGGTIDIPVTLLQTAGAAGTPDGGLNHLIAVSSSDPYTIGQQVSNTSNAITLFYDPNAGSDLTLTYTLQGRSDHSADLTIAVYLQGTSTPVYQFTPVGSATGEAQVTGLAPGLYDVEVKAARYLQKLGTIEVVSGTNSLDVAELRAGDANDDNQVTTLDFSILASTFNVASTDAGFDERADFNGDGQVTTLDFSLLASNFNTAGEEVPIN